MRIVVKWSGQFFRVLCLAAMKKAAALALLIAAPCAHATLTPLPGVQGQTARVLSVLAVPIRFHVSDAAGRPVANAHVDVSVKNGPTSPNPSLVPFGGLNPPPAYSSYYSNQDGDTTTNDLYSAQLVGTYVLHADSDYGSTDVTVNIVDGARPDRLEVVGGASQSIPGNTLAPQPFAVRVLDTGGKPFPRPSVSFYQFEHSATLYNAAGIFESVLGNYTDDLGYASDENGIATSSAFRALPFPGDGVINARVSRGPVADWAITIDIPFTVTAPAPGTPSSYQDMWWGGDLENGWGLSVIEHDRRMFVIVFAYDSTGKPTWYVVPDATWQLAEGLGLSGHLYQPTASPYTAFDTNSVIAGPALGTLIVSFQSANEARLSIGSVKPGGPPAIAKQIQRMTYGDPAAATRGVSEMWWGGPAQSGWGVSVIEHTGTFFSVWYTYGADRKAT